MFLETKGFVVSNNIHIFDGIEVHRPSNNNREITVDILNEMYDHLKTILNVSITFSAGRHIDGKPIKISPMRECEELKGKPFIIVNRLPVTKKWKQSTELENDKRSRREDSGGGPVREGVHSDLEAAEYV